MAGFDGNGNYIRSYSWSIDATNGIDITASRVDTEDNGFASALSNCVTRDGQGKMQTHFIPGTASVYDVGSVGVPWRNVYCSVLNATTIVGNIISTGISYPATPAEIAILGITPPATPQWNPYDIRRYAVTVGNGVVSDDAVFALAKSIAGSEPIFVPSLGYKWNLSTFTDGNFISDGTLLFVGHGYVKYKTLQGNSVNDNNVSIAGIHWNAPQIVILGDSITEGTGAPTIQAGYSFGVARSIMNAVNNGFDYDPGFGYHTTVNLSDAITMSEISTTGSISATGLVGNRISLTAGQSITISNKSVVSIDVIYDGAVSSGNIVFALNGTTYATKATSGAVLNSTFQTLIRTSNGVGGCTNESDVITITASANLVITSIVALKTSSGGPQVFIAPQSGTTYGDFTAAAKITELAFYLNYLRSSSEKLLILALGTNSIYNAGKATTPTAMITAIASIVSQVNALATNVRYAIHIPPRAAEGTFPVITAGFTHADYVNALEDYARSNNVTLIRHDRSALSYGNLYADGLHPNSQGHRIMAKTVCDTLGIIFNPYLKTTLNDFQFNNQIDVPYNSTWRSFSNSATNRVVATRVGNTITLSGIAEPNASVSTTIAILPVGYRPVGRTCFYTGRSDVGTFAAGLSIDTGGNIICASVPSSFFSLEGISFTITRP